MPLPHETFQVTTTRSGQVIAAPTGLADTDNAIQGPILNVAGATQFHLLSKVVFADPGDGYLRIQVVATQPASPANFFFEILPEANGSGAAHMASLDCSTWLQARVSVQMVKWAWAANASATTLAVSYSITGV